LRPRNEKDALRGPNKTRSLGQVRNFELFNPALPAGPHKVFCAERMKRNDYERF
jgi:hypothetical protein